MSSFAGSRRIPIIDLSLFDLGGAWRERVAAEVDHAASATGFFYITGHGVDSFAIEPLLRSSRTLRTREGLAFTNEPGETVPDVPGLRDAVLDYTRLLTGLGHKLMALFGRGLQLGDNYFVDRYTGSPVTRFNLSNSSHGMSKRAHRGLVTLLYQDELAGLQVMSGSEWQDVPFLPGSLVVLVGEMLERLTAGRYPSVACRVVHHPARPGVTLPFDFDSGFDGELAPIPGVARLPAVQNRVTSRGATAWLSRP